MSASSSTARNRISAVSQHLSPSSSSSTASKHVKEQTKDKMTTDYKFQGWMGQDKESATGKLVWQEYEPKTWAEDDVDIKITHCGICGSDIHTLRSGWGPTMYPCCVGHEIVGTAVKVGKSVSRIKLGDRVGVGAQSSSCRQCEACKEGKEQYCERGLVGTYNSKYADGSKSYGGYADYCRVPAHFVVRIPDGMSMAEAAPMLCGGVTVWNPLRNAGAGPGKRVGIVGIGGLGHFGLLWAKALGCDEVVAISRSSSKAEDAKKMGADRFIATGEDKNWAKKNTRTLDLLVSTISGPDMPLSQYFRLLRTNGEFIQVGAPEDKIPAFSAFSLIAKGCKMGGSSIGSPKDIQDMLEFAYSKGIKPWIEVRDMDQANKAIVDMEDGNARYRYVLRNKKHADALGV